MFNEKEEKEETYFQVFLTFIYKIKKDPQFPN